MAREETVAISGSEGLVELTQPSPPGNSAGAQACLQFVQLDDINTGPGKLGKGAAARLCLFEQTPGAIRVQYGQATMSVGNRRLVRQDREASFFARATHGVLCICGAILHLSLRFESFYGQLCPDGAETVESQSPAAWAKARAPVGRSIGRF